MKYVTREELIKELSVKSEYYQRDIRKVMKCLDEIIADHLSEATDDEEIWVQLFTGVKLKGFVMPERERINPVDRSPIICEKRCNVQCKVSTHYKDMVNEKYKEKNKDD